MTGPRLLLPLLLLTAGAGCATDGGHSRSMVGRPLADAVRTIGYLPDAREDAGGESVYRWELGMRSGRFNSPANSDTVGYPMRGGCIVRVVTGSEGLIRDIGYEGSHGSCASISRRLGFPRS